jgi:hypothetical protein
VTIELTKEDLTMIRASAGDLDGAGVQALITGVVARLEKAIDSGVVTAITKNTIRAATTAQLNAGK